MKRIINNIVDIINKSEVRDNCLNSFITVSTLIIYSFKKLKLNKGIMTLLCLHTGANFCGDGGAEGGAEGGTEGGAEGGADGTVLISSSVSDLVGVAIISGVVATSDDKRTSSNVVCPETPLPTDESSSPSIMAGDTSLSLSSGKPTPGSVD